VRIGQNINQAVHAMNAANQPESSLDIAKIAPQFLDTCTDLKSIVFAARREVSSCIGGEVGYWIEATSWRARARSSELSLFLWHARFSR
jgi:hypothetical protein